jgi:hypothetical protein
MYPSGAKHSFQLRSLEPKLTAMFPSPGNSVTLELRYLTAVNVVHILRILVRPCITAAYIPKCPSE